MKKLLRRLLAAMGLAPASVVASQARQIQESRSGLLAWKKKAGEAVARVTSLEAELEGQRHASEQLEISFDELRRRHDHIEQLLRQRLVVADADLATARESLAAVNARLDLLEGAANVLDVRTRSASFRQDGETVAPV